MKRKLSAQILVYRLLIVVLSSFLGLLAFKQFKLSLIKPAAKYQVIKVLDGDTFVINQSQRVRLLGIDAPALDHCLGQEAKTYLESLLKDKEVTLEEVAADRFGRIIALVYQGKTLINLAMIEQGLAEYDGHKNSRADLLRQAEVEAKLNQLGIFSSQCTQPENPDRPECRIKGNLRDGKKYYSFPGCSNYDRTIIELHHGDQWFCTEAQASKAGFKKSKNCYNKKYPSKSS